MLRTTLKDFLRETEQAFLKASLHFGHGTNNAWDEAVAIALAILRLPPDVDNTVLNRKLSLEELQALRFLADRRIRERIPLPYLTQEAWFMGLKFYVDERVIIPRSPLAELIQDGFKPWWSKPTPPGRILDLCTGSGCIAVACSTIFPEATIDAVDISLGALEVAQQNIKLHHREDKVQLLNSDLFKACEGKQYDIIISNPPYVSLQEMESLPAEYHFEPSLALSAEDNGLSIVRRILSEAPRYLATQGLLVVEVGNSEEAVKEAYPALPFIWLEFERGGQGVFLLEKEEEKCYINFY